MATISPKDRARLVMALENQIPAIQDQHLLNLFSLILALLRDYKELEACALKQERSMLSETADMKQICCQCRQLM